ncbi:MULTISPECIES: tyrosinase family protein [unclassified Caballeronia]|uniref:tyrosinase family protein n=1 Tax=unclassified Caballeronia TaxID=2646786 RepID=UPI00286716ED|nr:MULTISPECIES: tyrosinase family protein [unclassified Caballeronia]MDR5740479.1 tyrosinase family protein [Caballeronia sp. LZ016]MDR5809000.1 tyrosinase family protein [Caballeronia sp. LZ019]
MDSTSIKRRAFVKGTASALALASLPKLAGAVTTPVVRLEWQAFKSTTHYASFLNAVRTMKGMTDASKPASWQYWVNVHRNYCPHSEPYFLAWHRGYMYYIEQQLKTTSGDTGLTLPYWDYYTYPVIPSEFTDTASGNPLYVSRVNSNVYQALDLSPFASTVVNMQRGTRNAFETKFENAPHNPVHDIIGGYMGNILTAPIDPIFYLHHCNIDRLWSAWELRSTSKVPAATNSYWSGSFTYANSLTMAKSKTRMVSNLGYTYANNSMPVVLPPQAQRGGIVRVQAQVSSIHGRPQAGTFTATPGRSISATRRSLGGVRGVGLGNASLSAVIPLAATNATALKDVLASSPATTLDESSEAPQAAGPGKASLRHVKLVLDGLAITAAGQNGGFFYNVYLNLPATGDVDAVKGDHFVGTLGAFEISTATHHGTNMIAFDVTEQLARLGVGNPNQLVVSFVRVSGLNAPKGNVVSVDELRVELSADGS